MEDMANTEVLANMEDMEKKEVMGNMEDTQNLNVSSQLTYSKLGISGGVA